MSITRPALLLRLEGAAELTAAVVAFAVSGGSWVLFVILLLAPDLALVGYLGGPRRGAAAYNLAHTYAFPVLLAAAGLLTDNRLLLHLALIWGAHIGGDRLLGFGLKYPTGFQDTHLQRL
jgi:hypothetical protein